MNECKTEFKRAVNIVLKLEGGYVNDIHDPGGETRYGISKRAYPNEDIKNMTKDRAREIYYNDYWKACNCDELPKSLKLIVFDCAVNQGVSFATKTLQRLVETKPDGNIGPKTIEAISEFNEFKLMERFSMKRLNAYYNNRNFFRYGKGWLKRLTHVLIMINQK